MSDDTNSESSLGAVVVQAIDRRVTARLRLIELRKIFASTLLIQSKLGEAIDTLSQSVEALEGQPSEATKACRNALKVANDELNDAIDRIGRAWKDVP